MTKLSIYFSRLIASIMMLVTLGGALVATTLVFTPSSVSAQAACTNNNSTRLPSFGNNCIGGVTSITGDRNGIAGIIKTVADFLIFILAAISVVFIVYGGFLYVTDNGDGSNSGKGKKIVFNALIGLVVAVVSYTLVTLVVNLVSSLNLGSGGGGGSTTSGQPGMIDILK